MYQTLFCKVIAGNLQWGFGDWGMNAKMFVDVYISLVYK